MNKPLVLTALGLFLAVHVAVALIVWLGFGCGAVRVARSARYEAGCSLAAALARACWGLQGRIATAKTAEAVDTLPDAP